MAVYIPDALKTIQVAFHPPIGFSGTVMIQNDVRLHISRKRWYHDKLLWLSYVDDLKSQRFFCCSVYIRLRRQCWWYISTVPSDVSYKWSMSPSHTAVLVGLSPYTQEACIVFWYLDFHKFLFLSVQKWSLRKILRITWEDRRTNISVLLAADTTSIRLWSSATNSDGPVTSSVCQTTASPNKCSSHS